MPIFGRIPGSLLSDFGFLAKASRYVFEYFVVRITLSHDGKGTTIAQSVLYIAWIGVRSGLSLFFRSKFPIPPIL